MYMHINIIIHAYMYTYKYTAVSATTQWHPLWPLTSQFLELLDGGSRGSRGSSLQNHIKKRQDIYSSGPKLR